MGSPLDGYSLKARYLPALIVLLPIWLAFAVWFPPDKQFIAVFASAGLTLVLSVLLAQLQKDFSQVARLWWMLIEFRLFAAENQAW